MDDDDFCAQPNDTGNGDDDYFFKRDNFLFETILD